MILFLYSSHNMFFYSFSGLHFITPGRILKMLHTCKINVAPFTTQLLEMRNLGDVAG